MDRVDRLDIGYAPLSYLSGNRLFHQAGVYAACQVAWPRGYRYYQGSRKLDRNSKHHEVFRSFHSYDATCRQHTQ